MESQFNSREREKERDRKCAIYLVPIYSLAIAVIRNVEGMLNKAGVSLLVMHEMYHDANHRGNVTEEVYARYGIH